jgi:CRP-like cAMP-binding protein
VLHLLEGIVYRYKLLADGGRQIASFQFPGDMFDSQSFLLQEMDNSIASIGSSTKVTIPHASVAELTVAHPEVARAVEGNADRRGRFPRVDCQHRKETST